MPLGDGSVDIVPVEGTVGRNRSDRTADLVEQGAELRVIIDIMVGQHRRDDPSSVGVRAEMELAPSPARPGTVLLNQPLARAA
jgi:hypothetical protein